MDAGPAGQCDLGHQMGGTTEPVDPEPAALGEVGPQQGPVADDPGTEEGRHLHVVEFVGERVGVRLFHHDVVGVAPVDVPAGEAWPEAEVLSPRGAEAADPAGVRQPGHPDAVTLPPAGAPGTELVDHTDDLVPWRDPRPAWDQVALGEVEVRPAHAAGPDAHPHLAGPRLGNGLVHPHQRVRVPLDGAGLVDHPRLHDRQRRSVRTGVGPTMTTDEERPCTQGHGLSGAAAHDGARPRRAVRDRRARRRSPSSRTTVPAARRHGRCGGARTGARGHHSRLRGGDDGGVGARPPSGLPDTPGVVLRGGRRAS